MALLKPSADFDEFVVAASPRLLKLAYRLTGDRGHAEDLLQICLWRVARRWRTARENPVGYARRVLANLAADGWRRRRRYPLEVPTADILDVANSGEWTPQAAIDDREVLLRGMRLLPARTRTILVLRYWEDLSVEETAILLGCSVGTVKSTSSRGLERLRAVLERMEAQT